MKKQNPSFYRNGLRLMAAAAFVLASSQLHAANLYFDQNGTAANFMITGVTAYNWNTTDLGWNTSAAGTAATVQWVDGSTFLFGGKDSAGSVGTSNFSINLQNDVTVAGLKVIGAGGGLPSGKTLTISSASARNITLLPNADIVNDAGSTRPFIIGDNVNLLGDFTLSSTSGTNQKGIFRYEGAGDKYVGTITTGTNGITGVAGGGNVVISSGSTTVSRFGKDTKIVLNEGASILVDSAMTIGRLSGNGGDVGRNTVTSGIALTVDQDETTEWKGVVGLAARPEVQFIKKGTGTLSLTGTVAHATTKNVTVDAGSLYIGQALVASGTAIVNAAGNLGGTTTSSKKVVMNGETSRLSPGMLDVASIQKVGTMTLANGLEAKTGGTFLFALNGDDGLGGNSNSKIVLSAGAIALATDPLTERFIIKLTDLGFGDIQADTPYTLFSTSSVIANFGTFASRWELDASTLPAGFTATASPFTVVSNGLGEDIQISFQAVPEPSSVLLSLVGVSGLLLVLKRRKS